ncbi:globin [Raineyella sp.]|uniref:globin n=1 Tax=Raineyella sp. TaxID=1911550 RepID=UPI002B208732|nr:globin [Raineyella sp.]MEA5155071.1 globin [Raineyella sp.]
MSENPTGPETADQPTPYERMGGAETFRAIVHRFYENVRKTPDLHAMYPEEDLGPAEDRLRMFLEQYWGGPGTYSEQRGHPRLRMRHEPFKVTPTQRDNWLECMHDAVGSVEMDKAARDELWTYLVRAADAMINAFEGEDMTPQPGRNLL